MDLDNYWVGAALIIGLAFLSVAGLLAVRRYIHLDNLRKCHEVGGYLLSVVGTMYAVLLGLVVVDSMTKFQTARAVVEQEANSLADVFLLSETCRPPFNTEVRKLCSDYVNEVLDKEWEDMSRGRICPDARRDVVRLINKVKQYEPVTENEKAIYPILVQEALQVWIIAAPGLISQATVCPVWNGLSSSLVA